MKHSIGLIELASPDRKIRRAIKLREARFEDYESITKLEARYGLETKTYEEWSGLWLRNPTYSALCEGWPIGWVLDDENDGIVGHIGNIPRSYELGGEPIITAVTHAWVVDTAFRSYSILLLDRYFSQKNVDLYLSTTVNAQASEAFTSFGSLRTPVGSWDRSLFWITSSHGFATSWAAMKGFPISTPLQYALSAAVAAKNLSLKRALNAHGGTSDLEYLNGFDGRFDVFWSALKRERRTVLLASRSREALEWQFQYATFSHNLWVLAVRNGRAITSYSIFCRQDNPKIGLKRMRLVDFQTLDGNTATLQRMISWALKKCGEEGVHMLECIGLPPDADRILRNLAPEERILPCWLYYYKPANAVLGDRLAEADAWNPALFDGDSSL